MRQRPIATTIQDLPLLLDEAHTTVCNKPEEPAFVPVVKRCDKQQNGRQWRRSRSRSHERRTGAKPIVVKPIRNTGNDGQGQMQPPHSQSQQQKDGGNVGRTLTPHQKRRIEEQEWFKDGTYQQKRDAMYRRMGLCSIPGTPCGPAVSRRSKYSVPEIEDSNICNLSYLYYRCIT